jgi:ABC-type cobalamin/Fe3+-siderophores transport system ATPase subunit
MLRSDSERRIVIKAVHLKNFKALKHATLPLGRFTLIVGPNGSGKSTALQALKALGNPGTVDFNLIVTASLPSAATVEVRAEWGGAS